jgi:mono/diheme cytochrome c family protein
MKNMASVLIFLTAAAWAAGNLTDTQLKAQFYYDLGPDTIDVSGYPKAQQDAYAVFQKTCSQCHTLARPINAPYVTSRDWQRYILRMHEKTKSRPGTVISKEDAKVIVDFLVSDAKVRKVSHKKAFNLETAKLKALFEDVKAERSRRQVTTDEGKVKQTAPYIGTKP